MEIDLGPVEYVEITLSLCLGEPCVEGEATACGPWLNEGQRTEMGASMVHANPFVDEGTVRVTKRSI